MTSFIRIAPGDFDSRIVSLIGEKWFLLTAGTPDRLNTMTCAWGGMGYLWNRPVCFVFVRPQRYTFDFMERHDTFALSFLNHAHREILTYCGTHSGRDVDKIKETGLLPVFDDRGYIYFDQADIAVLCRKMYFNDIRRGGFTAVKDREAIYPEEDFHRMYIGEIHEILRRS